MSLFDSWKSVADAYGIPDGGGVRVTLTFSLLPLSSVGDSEWSEFLPQAGITVTEVETNAYGARITGVVAGSITVGELRQRVLAAVAAMNQARWFDLLDVSVYSIEVPDSGGGGLGGLGFGLGFGAVAALIVAGIVVYFVYFKRR